MKKIITLIMALLLVLSGCGNKAKDYLEDADQLKMLRHVKDGSKKIIEYNRLIDENAHYEIVKEKNDEFPILFNLVIDNEVAYTIQVEFCTMDEMKNGWYTAYKDGYITSNILNEKTEFNNEAYRMDITDWILYKNVTNVQRTDYYLSDIAKKSFEDGLEITIENVRMLMELDDKAEITFGKPDIERYTIQYDSKETFIMSPLVDYAYYPVYVNGELKGILDYRCTGGGESIGASVDTDQLFKCYNEHYLVAMIDETAITEDGLFQIGSKDIPYMIQKAYDILNKH